MPCVRDVYKRQGHAVALRMRHRNALADGSGALSLSRQDRRLVGRRYFIVTRLYNFNEKILNLALVIGGAACLFGITDYFKMDLLHFKAEIGARQKALYVSTIGNINTYTVYVGILLALAVVLFATAKTWKNVVFYYICSIIFMFALIMGQSDNAYLSVAAIYGFTPLYLFKDHRGIRRYAISAASFFTVIQCIDFINQNFADHVYGITGVFKVITNLSFLLAAVVLLWEMCLRDRDFRKKCQYKLDEIKARIAG